MGVPDIIKQAARDLRKNQTESEKLFWDKLRRKAGSLKIYRQKPILVAYEGNGFERYVIVDFYFPNLKLVVELDGGIHNKEEIYLLDREKEVLLENLGYKILRFKNEQVLSNIDSVIKKLYPLSLRRRERIQERDI